MGKERAKFKQAIQAVAWALFAGVFMAGFMLLGDYTLGSKLEPVELYWTRGVLFAGFLLIWIFARPVLMRRGLWPRGVFIAPREDFEERRQQLKDERQRIFDEASKKIEAKQVAVNGQG